MEICHSTNLPIYSPAKRQPHLWHVKHHKCHCLSRANNAWPLFISLPHPAQPKTKKLSPESCTILSSTISYYVIDRKKYFNFTVVVLLKDPIGTYNSQNLHSNLKVL